MHDTKNIYEGRVLVVLIFSFVLAVVVGGPYLSDALEIQTLKPVNGGPQGKAEILSLREESKSSDFRFINSFFEQELTPEQWWLMKPRVAKIMQEDLPRKQYLEKILDLVPQSEE